MTMTWTPFLYVDGQAEEAIEFYGKALGAKLVFKQTYGEAPDGSGKELPAERQRLVAHSVLQAGESTLFVADVEPGMAASHGSKVSLCVETSDAEQARILFDLLADGGQVALPLQPVHFSPAYGIVTDRFGVQMLVSARRPQA
ncbi:VOC family protein [Paenibacillus albicereus]|uniref:VOC family protein n=1 Tax=Paenibacillus albicereus TaxID=2726185 RepID=A0A6H2GZ07_9BACL|nr:VOC family protein [Paenibacillus albicereus]QJC52671.1 VOC family protein [Paenibacillus albicereus]